MTRDELEISISQYVDGTLADEDRVALEARLAEDSAARGLLEEDQALTRLLRSQPLPEVQWDRLAASISSAIDQDLEERATRASFWLRRRLPVGLAAAAAIVLSIGVAVHIALQPGHPGPVTPIGPVQGRQTAVLTVEGPTPDAPAGQVVSEISISAGGSYAKDSSLSPYADELDTRPSRVIIASGAPTAQRHIGFPY